MRLVLLSHSARTYLTNTDIYLARGRRIQPITIKSNDHTISVCILGTLWHDTVDAIHNPCILQIASDGYYLFLLGNRYAYPEAF